LEVGGTLMHLELLPAREGDCLWIEYTVHGAPQRAIIVVDGGPRGTGRLLIDRMERERVKRGGALHVELLVITHIDSDHIAGVIELLEKNPPWLSFGDIWFNGDAQLSQLLGTDEGDRLSELLRGKPWNCAFGGMAVGVADDETLPLPTYDFIGGLKVTILGPTRERLSALADVWASLVDYIEGATEESAAFARADILGREDPWPPEPVTPSSDLDASIPNGSSIALLLEQGSRTLLLSGDAFATDLERAVARLRAERRLSRLSIGGFKLPHHGSQGNVTRALLEQLSCEHYLFSTNGGRYHHPDHPAIMRVLAYSKLRPSLHFNYATPKTLLWCDARRDVPGRPDYSVFYGDEGRGVSFDVDPVD
jgi:hypothetical protein